MAKKQKKSPLILLVVFLVLIAGFLVYKYIQLPNQNTLNVEDTCKDLKFGEWDSFSPRIVNTGANNLYVKACISSEEFVFNNEENSYCTEERKILPFNNSISVEFKANSVDIAENINKALITVEIKCKTKFLFLQKDCGLIRYECNYDKLNLLGLPS